MTRRGTTGATTALWLSLSLTVALLGGVSMAVAPAAATGASVDGGTITQCGTIDQRGDYELGGDITVANAETCLTVTADGVTIDGAGHVVDGVDNDSLSDGLTVKGDDVTVRDLTVRGWEQGLRVEGDGFLGEGVTATRNGDVGVAMFGTADATLADSTVTENGHTGVYTTGASDTLLDGNTVQDHAAYGVHVDGDDGGSAVKDGLVADSGQFGVYVTDGTGPRIDGTTVRDTAQAPNVDGDGVGIYTRAPGTVVEGVTVTGSASHGIQVVGGDEATGFEVRSVTVRGNAGDGVRVDGTRATAVSMVTASENRDGLNLTEATRPSVSSAVVESNDRHGVAVGGGSKVTLNAVEAADNGAWAVRLWNDPGAVEAADLILDSATLDFTANDVAVGPAPVPGGERPAGGATVGAFFNATTTAATEGGTTGGLTGMTGDGGSAGYLDVDVSYTDSAASAVEQSTLNLTRYDGGNWTTFASNVDTDANTVSANLTDPAAGVAGGDVFGPLGDVEGAVVECTTIDTPGEYVLDTDLTGVSGTCLTVASGDVHLLGSGHRLAGDDTGTGVLVDAGAGASNVTVSGLEVSGFARGVALFDTDGATVADVNASDNVNAGLAANDSTGLTLRGVRADANGREGSAIDTIFGGGATESADGVGILLSNVDDATVTETSASDNLGEDIALVDGTVADLGPTAVNGTTVTLTDARDVVLSPVENSEPSGDGYEAVGSYVNISATSEQARATVTLGYDESAVDDESALVLGKFDGDWTYFEGADTDANTVSAEVTSFSQFAVLEAQGGGSDGGTETPTPTPTPTATPTPTETPGGGDGGGGAGTPTPTPSDDGGSSGTGGGGSGGTSGGGGGGSGGAARNGGGGGSPGSADVVVVEASLNRSAASAGETVWVTATAENQGDARDESEVPLYVDDQFVESRFVTLDPGERRTLTFDRTFEDAGTYEIRTGEVVAGTLNVTAPAGSGDGAETTATTTPTATPTATSTETPSRTPTPTATPTPTPDTDAADDTGDASAGEATATPTPTGTPQQTDRPAAAAQTATPTGTVAPADGQASIEGTPRAPASLADGPISVLGLVAGVVAIGGGVYLIFRT